MVAMQRLGKNHGGYHGETIDIRAVLGELKAAAVAHGWSAETFYRIGDLELLALQRAPLSTRDSQPSTRLYISAGIHGDEPAGPLAALRLLQENHWPADAEVWLLPCLNPTGFILNSRENDGRKDLNRDYRHLETEEVAAHIRWLERQLSGFGAASIGEQVQGGGLCPTAKHQGAYTGGAIGGNGGHLQPDEPAF